MKNVVVTKRKYTKHTDLNCQCITCRSKRDEYRGENHHNYGKSSTYRNHRLDCQCCICKAKRKVNVEHRLDCQCCVCKAKRGETKGILLGKRKKNHKENCQCITCGVKRGEFNYITAELRRRWSRIQKERWSDLEYKDKQVKAIMRGMHVRPTEPEKQLNKLLQKLFPDQWKYVGDGQIVIGGKNPDFIFINGQKKIIEVFSDYWHSEEMTGVSGEQHELERVNHFEQYGYQTLIIWQCELNDIDLLTVRLFEFNERK